MWPRSKASQDVGAAEMASLCARLAVFLQAGLSPGRAWAELASDESQPAPARQFAQRISQAMSGATGHAAAVRAVCQGGSEPERVFSAMLSVADESGTPLYRALWSLAEALRDRIGIEADIQAMVQVPRQTTWLLLALPPLSIVIAGMLGVDAIGFLIGSALGWGLLVGGIILYVAAIAWMRRLVAQLIPDRGYLSPARDLLAVATRGGALPEIARQRVERVLADHSLAKGDSNALAALTQLSRRAGIPIGVLASVEASWQRHQVRADAAQATQALSVRILIPLGLLILPAFVMVGVVPVVFTLLRGALGSGLAPPF